MSWRENIDTKLVIVTGDGKRYTPDYEITSKTTEFNNSQYNFPELDGTLVDRRRVKSPVHSLLVHFQGEDHLEVSTAFETSAKDKRIWTIYHPMYGNLNGHPISIEYDPTGLSKTTVTIEFMESIVINPPVVSIDPEMQIKNNSKIAQDQAIESFDTNILELSSSDRVSMNDTVSSVNTSSQAVEKTQEEASDYLQLFKKAENAISGGISTGSALAQTVINVLTYPALFTAPIKTRIILLKNQFLSISNSLENITTKNEKYIYEFNCTGLISTMAQTSVTINELGGYESAVDVIAVTDIILEVYNQYIENLDSLQSEVGDTPESYIPDADVLNTLNGLINFTISQLYLIALSSKQERIVYLEKDSNPISLAHRFYGLKTGDDSELNNFINQNNIGLDELLQIKKGRKLVYYV